MSAQSTDEANSAPLGDATALPNDLKQLSSRTTKEVAADIDGPSGLSSDPVIAPEAS